MNLRLQLKDILILLAFMALGALLAYMDQQWGLHTMLVESLHIVVIGVVLYYCMAWQRRYPGILQFGWDKIMLGVLCLMIGALVDVLDDPPMLSLLQWGDNPFGRTWEQAFLKKVVGYSIGFGLVALGFFQWIPWMIASRLQMETLNTTLSQTNRNLKNLLTSLDDHVEAERLTISRELHDDVAQQLTALKFQTQLTEKAMDQDERRARELLRQVGDGISETLKSVRQISRDLRPEPLYALGLVAATEQFLDKLQHQFPQIQFSIDFVPFPDATQRTPLEPMVGDRNLLHLFRLLQESVRNAVKHSQGELIDVLIYEEANQFRFVIEDDGKGLPWTQMPSDETLVQKGHLGIVGMKERVDELGAKFSIAGLPNGGTRVEILLPKTESALPGHDAQTTA